MIFTDKLLDFQDFLCHSDVYVETGSATGESIKRALQAGYRNIRSVEVYQPFYTLCLEKFKGHPYVDLFLGKSDETLPGMLYGLNRCVIFLDAHPAGPNTGGHDDLMEKGDKSTFAQDYVLRNEIKAILAHRNDHIVIIDDQNGPNEDNAEYMKMFLEANPDYKFYWYDEKLDENAIFYKNKSLVAIPC